jgi:hypothetical protein
VTATTTMTAKIHYETPDGIETIIRDEWHVNNGMMITFDNPESAGLENKVSIPKERIVRVDG